MQQTIDALRREYEQFENIPLWVRFVGDVRDETLATVVPALLAQDFPSKAIGAQIIIDEDRGLRVYATKAFRPDWFSVNDRVGWVDRNPEKRIVEVVSPVVV